MDAPGRRYDAITFDFWDTLICAPTGADSRRARNERVHKVLRGAGIHLDDDLVDAAVAEVGDTFHRRWAGNDPFSAVEAAAVLAAHLPGSLPPGEAGEVLLVELAECFATTRNPPPVRPTTNIAPTLEALRDRGLRLGIICDVGLQPASVLRIHLERHGLLAMFDHWSFSDEVGVYKPDAAIFEHALAGLGGVAPARAAHVGDLRRTDIAGARGMGMTAVRYRGRKDDPDFPGAPEGDHVIDDHTALLATLGLA